MKKSLKSDGIDSAITVQEKIIELQEDLLTVLESYMDEMDTELLFCESFKFMTVAMYQCFDSHQNALKVLKLARGQGIENVMEKRKH